MTFLRLYWQYIVMAIMAGIIGIQELEIKQLKIDELQAKVKVVEHIVTMQERFSEIRNHKLNGSAVAKRMRDASF